MTWIHSRPMACCSQFSGTWWLEHVGTHERQVETNFAQRIHIFHGMLREFDRSIIYTSLSLSLSLSLHRCRYIYIYMYNIYICIYQWSSLGYLTSANFFRKPRISTASDVTGCHALSVLPQVKHSPPEALTLRHSSGWFSGIFLRNL